MRGPQCAWLAVQDPRRRENRATAPAAAGARPIVALAAGAPKEPPAREPWVSPPGNSRAPRAGIDSRTPGRASRRARFAAGPVEPPTGVSAGQQQGGASPP